jgi:hypothetical protein
MDRYASPNSYSIRSEEQEEQLYCSVPQDPEDIICEGSDTEQTAAEIRKKRHRYEEIGRRYLGGYRPPIQSASLRGPLNPESGWVNPWRSRLRKEADRWQQGSEEVSFTRANVMKGAADGLGYLNPDEALAWCKAVAEIEARDQFDSMDVAHHSGAESDLEESGDVSPRYDIPQAQPGPKSANDGHQSSHGHTSNPSAHRSTVLHAQDDTTKSNDVMGSNRRHPKRPAESQWLKGSYVSKRARWEDHPISSPTPMPDPLSVRERRLRYSLNRSLSSGNGQHKPILQPTTPWPNDAQQWGVPRYSGSTAQGTKSKERDRSFGRQPKNLDEHHKESQETTFVSAPDFLSVSQVKKKRSMSIDRTVLHDALELRTDTSARIISFHTPMEEKRASIPRRSLSEPNQLPVLPRSAENQADEEQVGDDSFITEVAPSSRNLEKFQFRKKRTKSKMHKAKGSVEGSHDPLHMEPLPAPPPADAADEATFEVSVFMDHAQHLPMESLDDNSSDDHEDPFALDSVQHLPIESPESESSAGRDLAQQLPVGPPEDELNAESEKTPRMYERIHTVLSHEREVPRMQMGNISSESRRSDQSYFRKVAMLSANVLPNLQFSSPFALFGSFGASRTTPTTISAIGHNNTLQASEDDGEAQGIVSKEEATKDMTANRIRTATPATGQKPAPGTSVDVDHDNAFERTGDVIVDAALALPVASDGEDFDKGSPKPTAQSKESSQTFQTVVGDDQSVCPEGEPEALDASMLDVGNLPNSAVPQDADGMENAALPQPLSDPVVNSQATPRPHSPTNVTQETNIYDGSTQSFNTTVPVSLKRSRLSSQSSSVNERRISHHAVKSLEADAAEVAGPSDKEKHGEMEVIETALSQDCRGFSSSARTQSEKDKSSQQWVSAGSTEPEPGRITPLAPDDVNSAPPMGAEQESWQGCESQSPWAPEHIIPEPIARANQQNKQDEAFVIIKPPLQFSPISHRRVDAVADKHLFVDRLSTVREKLDDEEETAGAIIRSETIVMVEDANSEKLGSSLPHGEDERGSDWQFVDHPTTPDSNGITPFSNLMSPTPSPKRLETPSDHEDVSNTQQAIEFITKNPWDSDSKKPKKQISKKIKKRVSFDDITSEEEIDAEPRLPAHSKQGRGSPPPPKTSDNVCEEDTFDDGTTVMNNFGKHFSAVSRYKPKIQRVNGLVLNSPAVGAMAERFIAADRETSIEQERRPWLTESPTSHLKPKSDSRTNLSSEATDYDLEVNLNEFLGDAGEFLGDWSVDSEVKKIKDSRGRKNGRIEPNKSRESLGMKTIWS